MDNRGPTAKTTRTPTWSERCKERLYSWLMVESGRPPAYRDDYLIRDLKRALDYLNQRMKRKRIP